MGPPRDRLRRLAAPLAAWVAVSCLGVSFTHSHAAGATPHTHGCWSPRTPADRSDDGPHEPHRHFVLFGVEFPGDAAPDAAPAGAGVGHVDAAGSDCDPPHPAAADRFWGPSPVAFAVDSAAAPALPPPPVLSAPPSAFARRAVTGVLRS